jgi:uncharacterized protein (TIGR00251 family)
MPKPEGRPVSAPPFLSPHPEGVVVACWVVPGASRSEIKGRHGDALRVRVASPPEGGRANAEVCRLLERTLGGKARVESGTTSRSKRILVTGVTLDEAAEIVAGY